MRALDLHLSLVFLIRHYSHISSFNVQLQKCLFKEAYVRLVFKSGL